jgi:hypothetical protein
VGSTPSEANEFCQSTRSFRQDWAQGFTQPLTEMSTGNIKIIMFLGSKVRRVRRAEKFTPSVSHLSRQCGVLDITHNPIGLQGLLRG